MCIQNLSETAQLTTDQLTADELVNRLFALGNFIDVAEDPGAANESRTKALQRIRGILPPLRTQTALPYEIGMEPTLQELKALVSQNLEALKPDHPAQRPDLGSKIIRLLYNLSL